MCVFLCLCVWCVDIRTHVAWAFTENDRTSYARPPRTSAASWHWNIKTKGTPRLLPEEEPWCLCRCLALTYSYTRRYDICAMYVLCVCLSLTFRNRVCAEHGWGAWTHARRKCGCGCHARSTRSAQQNARQPKHCDGCACSVEWVSRDKSRGC